MITYSPCYHGEHTYKKYEALRVEIITLVELHTEIEIFTDFLHKEELEHYFLSIFSHLLLNKEKSNILKHIKIFAKDRKRARKIKKQLRKLVLPFGEIRKRQKHYFVETEIYG